MRSLIILVVLMLLFFSSGIGQTSGQVLTLHECYSILYRESPVPDKMKLDRQITDLNQRIASSGWYPEVELSARASYQSDIVQFPFESPNFDIPTFSKDHYNISLNITQPIFDGGRTGAAKDLNEKSGAVSEVSLENDLMQIKEQVDNIYFGILILQKQTELNKLMIDELNKQLDMVRSQVDNGVLLPGNQASLLAEILRREQELIMTEHDLSAGYKALSHVLGVEIRQDQKLQLPKRMSWQKDDGTNLRPELELIDSRKTLLDVQQNLTEADKLPVVSLFVRPSFGRPGFNFFEDNLQFNWIVGVQAQWSFKNTRNASIKSDRLELQKRKLTEDRTLFERNQNAALSRFDSQLQAIEEQINRDRDIIELQREVAKEKQSLVMEGAAHITEFISALNAQNRAQLQLEIRKIQRIQAMINYETEQGWTWK